MIVRWQRARGYACATPRLVCSCGVEQGDTDHLADFLDVLRRFGLCRVCREPWAPREVLLAAAAALTLALGPGWDGEHLISLSFVADDLPAADAVMNALMEAPFSVIISGARRARREEAAT